MKSWKNMSLCAILISTSSFSLPAKSMQELEVWPRPVITKKYNQNAIRSYVQRSDDPSGNKKLIKLAQDMNRDKNFVSRGYKEPKTTLQWFIEYFGL